MRHDVTAENLDPMHRDHEHHPLCTLELIADGHAARCPGAACPFWSDGCVLARVEYQLDARPDVARALLGLRDDLEQGQEVSLRDARERLERLEEHLGPASGAI
jgi:hypothetical protein